MFTLTKEGPAPPFLVELGSVFATRPESSYRIFAGVQNLSAIAGQETDNGGQRVL